MGDIVGIGNQLWQWFQRKRPPVKVLKSEEYTYHWEYDSARLWGAHAIVVCERELWSTVTHSEFMLKVNHPKRLRRSSEYQEASLEVLLEYYEKQGLRVVSLTVIGEDGEQEFFPLA